MARRQADRSEIVEWIGQQCNATVTEVRRLTARIPFARLVHLLLFPAMTTGRQLRAFWPTRRLDLFDTSCRRVARSC